jgi:hypothetical protein
MQNPAPRGGATAPTGEYSGTKNKPPVTAAEENMDFSKYRELLKKYLESKGIPADTDVTSGMKKDAIPEPRKQS